MGKVSAFIILGDGEHLPAKFNIPSVIAYRKGKSTNGELVTIKAFGEEAKPEDLGIEVEAKCLYSDNGNPLHEHSDGTWWHFDAAWSLEYGPFPTYAQAFEALLNYCNEFQQQKSAGLAIDVEGGLALLEERFPLTDKPFGGKPDSGGDEDELETEDSDSAGSD